MEPGGQFDLQQIFAAAAQMQSQLMSAQEELAQARVSGSAGGGLVRVTLDGQGELVDVTISADAIEPGDPAETAQTISDLVLAAARDARRELEDKQADLMESLAGGLGGPGGPGGAGGFPGLPGLPGFPGAPGGAGIPGLPGIPGPHPGSGSAGSGGAEGGGGQGGGGQGGADEDEDEGRPGAAGGH